MKMTEQKPNECRPRFHCSYTCYAKNIEKWLHWQVAQRQLYKSTNETPHMCLDFNLLHLFYCFHFTCLLAYEEEREKKTFGYDIRMHLYIFPLFFFTKVMKLIKWHQTQLIKLKFNPKLNYQQHTQLFFYVLRSFFLRKIRLSWVE